MFSLFYRRVTVLHVSFGQSQVPTFLPGSFDFCNIGFGHRELMYHQQEAKLKVQKFQHVEYGVLTVNDQFRSQSNSQFVRQISSKL